MVTGFACALTYARNEEQHYLPSAGPGQNQSSPWDNLLQPGPGGPGNGPRWFYRGQSPAWIVCRRDANAFPVSPSGRRQAAPDGCCLKCGTAFLAGILRIAAAWLEVGSRYRLRRDGTSLRAND